MAPRISLIPFRQKKGWPPNPPELSRVGRPLPVRRKLNVQCPSQAGRQAASHSPSPPQRPEAIPPRALRWELSAPGHLGSKPFSPPDRPPPLSCPFLPLAALALVPGHSGGACGAGSRSGREDRAGQGPPCLCSRRGCRQAGGRCTVFSVFSTENTVPHTPVVLVSFRSKSSLSSEGTQLLWNHSVLFSLTHIYTHTQVSARSAPRSLSGAACQLTPPRSSLGSSSLAQGNVRDAL